MERGCLPANSVVDVDELPPLPHAQGPTNYLRDPLSTWERLTLSNTFCESRAVSVLRQNKEDLNTYCLNMAVCRRKMKKGRQWTVDRRRSPFSQANGEGSVTESCFVFDPSCYDAAETILVSFGAWVIWTLWNAAKDWCTVLMGVMFSFFVVVQLLKCACMFLCCSILLLRVWKCLSITYQ